MASGEHHVVQLPAENEEPMILDQLRTIVIKKKAEDDEKQGDTNNFLPPSQAVQVFPGDFLDWSAEEDYPAALNPMIEIEDGETYSVGVRDNLPKYAMSDDMMTFLDEIPLSPGHCRCRNLTDVRECQVCRNIDKAWGVMEEVPREDRAVWVYQIMLICSNFSQM